MSPLPVPHTSPEVLPRLSAISTDICRPSVVLVKNPPIPITATPALMVVSLVLSLLLSPTTTDCADSVDRPNFPYDSDCNFRYLCMYMYCVGQKLNPTDFPTNRAKSAYKASFCEI